MRRIEEDLRSVGECEHRHAAPDVDGGGVGAAEPRIVRIEIEVRGIEDHVHGHAHVGVAADQLGERVALELLLEVETVRALQVVEPVAVLQFLELPLEHEVERRAQETAEHVRLFRHAADPEVDVFQAAGRGIGGRRLRRQKRVVGIDECLRRRAFVGDRRGARDGRVVPAGRHEVDERLVVPQGEPELGPALVRRQRRVPGRVEELPARLVERRDAFAAATCDVDGRQVERQADQRVTHRGGDELVELVADLLRQAAHDRARGLVGRQHTRRSAVVELERVEERIEESYLVVRAVRVGAVEPLRQHRVAETVDRVRELRDDGPVDARQAAEERVDQRLNRPRELLEHEVLILHLGDEPRGLEQALVVVPAGPCVNRAPRRNFGGGQQRVDPPVDVVPQAVVLGVEDEVHRRQPDVLVAAAVTGDEVPVQQLVVVRAVGLAGWHCAEVTDGRVGIGNESRRGHRVVRDVVEERVSRPEGVAWNEHTEPAVGGRVALHEHVAGPDHLREAVRPWLEVAVRVGEEERHVQHVLIDELDAQDMRRLRLHLGPVADVANLLAGAAALARRAEAAVEHQARLPRPAIHQRVRAEEDLV